MPPFRLKMPTGLQITPSILRGNRRFVEFAAPKKPRRDSICSARNVQGFPFLRKNYMNIMTMPPGSPFHAD